MTKRLYISLLAFVFFVSTTSLPITMHLCSMMGKSVAESCGMCSYEVNSKKSSHHNDNENSLQIKRAGSDCCSEQIIDSSVKDNFISNNSNVKDLNSLKYLSALVLTTDVIRIQTTGLYFNNIHSPPINNNNPVYLINSVFLI